MVKTNLLNTDNILEYPSEELIPYACYIDKQTILTKNADLLMTFKIPSFISNQAKVDLFEIRENLRFILSSYYKDQNISFYFTTVRKKADIIPFGEENSYFSQHISEIWNKQNDWDNQFVNEIYITIIISLDSTDNLLNPIFFLTSLSQTGVSSMYLKKIEKAKKTLKKFASTVVSKMADYDIKVLSMVEAEDGTFYSEHMRFFSLLVNLEKAYFPITYDSISDIIRMKKIAYGSDVIETDSGGDKKFASVLSIKTFQNMTPTQLDKVLQLPMELVITETCSFVNNKYVVSKYEDQKEMISLSEDLDLAYISGLDDLVANNSNSDTDYTLNQATIMVMDKTRNDLNQDLKKLYKSLDDIGLVAVKENVYLPTIFWSQLPANFRYLRRLYICPSDKLATYVSLFNFPVGKLRFNHWGNAITIIPTALNTPYFFNFHNQQNGNTMIVGLPDTGKTTIMNFLISQTSRINPKIFYIDTMRSSEIFINAMGGKYYRISPNATDEEKFMMNPFMIENTEENEKFLNEFIINLVDFQDDGFIEMGKKLTQLKSQYVNIPEVVKKIFTLKKEERTFEKVANLFNTEKTNLVFSKLAIWYKNPKTSFIFDNPANTDCSDHIIGISLKSIIENKNLTIPVVDYLFKIVEELADGEPFILAIDNAWEIIDNQYLHKRFFDMISELPKYNVATVITTKGADRISDSFITEPVNDYFATELYLANPKITPYYREVFSLQDEESRILSLMKVEDYNFLLKCLQDIVISSINLKDFEYYKKIFSNDNVSINAMKKAKESSKSEDPALWIPVFLKIMEEYERAVKMNKMKTNELNQLKWEEARSEENTTNKIISGGN